MPFLLEPQKSSKLEVDPILKGGPFLNLGIELNA
jgi:hypothetical protein